MPILVPYPDDWPDDVKFQDLINNWANQGMGQYLMDDKRVLICHVTRNTCVGGIATKHNEPFNPYGNLKVPRSLDGFARTSTELSRQSSYATEARPTPQVTTLPFSSTEV